ncbi:hypothetical protein LXL04_020872 [Taraxacum kok-saghyz]
MKLEAVKHVEAVGAMKLEDKELTGGCNGESEEEDSNLREIAEAVKVVDVVDVVVLNLLKL